MAGPVCDTLRQALVRSRASAQREWIAWRQGAAYRRLSRAWDDCITPEGGARAMAALLADADWADALFAPLAAALDADPLFDPPFKVSRDALRIGAVVDRRATGSLTATVMSARALANTPAPSTVVVSGRMTVIRVHASGGARLRRWRTVVVSDDASSAAMPPIHEQPPIALCDGDVITIDGRSDAYLIADAARDVVLLGATIATGASAVMREYDRASGRCVRIATLDERAARSQLLLSLLRATDTPAATPAFDAATRDPAFFIRWDAMRQWLTIDATAAMPRLAEMASDDPNAEIRIAAARTLDLAHATRARAQVAECPA